MSEDLHDDAPHDDGDAFPYHLRLYVAGQTTKSVAAPGQPQAGPARSTSPVATTSRS